MKAITVLPSNLPEGKVDFPKAERLVKGNPQRTTYPYFESTAGDMDVGIWCCEVGAWRIAFAEDTDEFFTVIEGRVRLHDMAGDAKDIGPGEAAVIPAGFQGMFEVLEPVKKYYVFVKRQQG